MDRVWTEKGVGEGTEMKEKERASGREGCGGGAEGKEGEAWQGEMGGPG